jgi:hypothetical protein
MPPLKKKIDTYKSEANDCKPLDTYFSTKTSNILVDSSQPIIIDTFDIKAVNITSLQYKNENTDKNMIPRDKILSNLVQYKISYNLQEIKNKIELLSDNELTEIFKIIKNNNEKYSTNKNGIFINLSTLKKTSIQEICNFIYFCENNDKLFDKEEEERARYKDIINE